MCGQLALGAGGSLQAGPVEPLWLSATHTV